jgi:nickel superoxide dismutase
MSLFHRIAQALEPTPVHAHCDIPCGIYDPHEAQVAAHTVLRMVDLIHELPSQGLDDLEVRNAMARYVKTKEDHAEKCKHEVRVIWGDYFTEEHLAKVPDLHALVWRIMKQASKARQGTDKEAAEDLVASVNQFAEAFWKTKDKPTRRVTAPFLPNKPLVVPQLR